jgi:hypothetical protein
MLVKGQPFAPEAHRHGLAHHGGLVILTCQLQFAGHGHGPWRAPQPPGLLPEFLGLAAVACFLANDLQPPRDRAPVPYARRRESAAQEFLGSAVVLGPVGPKPWQAAQPIQPKPPARIRSQPRMEELLGLLGLTHQEGGIQAGAVTGAGGPDGGGRRAEGVAGLPGSGLGCRAGRVGRTVI